MVTKVIWIVRRCRLLLFVACAACLFGAGAGAESLKVGITQVDGTTVQLRLSGMIRPSIGNTATIGFEVEGVGLIPLKGTWQVKRVSGSTVTLEPIGIVDQPLLGQIATIEVAEATKAVEATEPQVVLREEPAQAGKSGKQGILLGVPFGEDPNKGESAATSIIFSTVPEGEEYSAPIPTPLESRENCDLDFSHDYRKELLADKESKRQLLREQKSWKKIFSGKYWLGILTDRNISLAGQSYAGDPKGYRIIKIFPDTSAYRKLKVGDIIYSIDGKQVNSEAPWTDAIEQSDGDIKITIGRDCEVLDFDISLQFREK